MVEQSASSSDEPIERGWDSSDNQGKLGPNGEILDFLTNPEPTPEVDLYPPAPDKGYKAPSDPWDAPFRIQHYYRSWLLVILERACYDFVRSHLLEDMKSMLWWFQHFGERELGRRLEGRPWGEADHVDLTDTMQLLLTLMRQSDGIEGVDRDQIWNLVAAVTFLRHACVHRHPGTSLRVLSQAMALPVVLGDEQRAQELRDDLTRLQAKLDNSHSATAIEQDIQLRFKRAAWPVDIQDLTVHQLLYKILSLMEATFFRFAKLTVPEALNSENISVAEQLDMPGWQAFFKKHLESHMSIGSWWGVRKMRNYWAHRLVVEKEDVVEWVHCSLTIAWDLDDFATASEIEIMAEQWLMKTSRFNVLQRIQRVNRDNRERDRKRQLAMDDALAAESAALIPDPATFDPSDDSITPRTKTSTSADTPSAPEFSDTVSSSATQPENTEATVPQGDEIPMTEAAEAPPSIEPTPSTAIPAVSYFAWPQSMHACLQDERFWDGPEPSSRAPVQTEAAYGRNPEYPDDVRADDPDAIGETQNDDPAQDAAVPDDESRSEPGADALETEAEQSRTDW